MLRKLKLIILRRLRCKYVDIRNNNITCNTYNDHLCNREECRIHEEKYNKIWGES